MRPRSLGRSEMPGEPGKLGSHLVCRRNPGALSLAGSGRGREVLVVLRLPLGGQAPGEVKPGPETQGNKSLGKTPEALGVGPRNSRTKGSQEISQVCPMEAKSCNCRTRKGES